MTNLARFTGMLQGQRDLAAVGRMLLSELAELVNAQQGVIYQMEATGGRQLCPSIELSTADQIKLAREHGLEIRPWGIRNIEFMQKALDFGVDGMTVDFPDKLIEALKKKSG